MTNGGWRRRPEDSVRDLLGRIRRSPQATAPRRQQAPRPAPSQQAPSPSTPAPAAAPPAPAPPPQQWPAEPRPATVDPELMTRLQDIEDRLSSLNDLQDLSELLSIRYNPFLDVDEDDVFEGRHEVPELVASRLHGGARTSHPAPPAAAAPARAPPPTRREPGKAVRSFSETPPELDPARADRHRRYLEPSDPGPAPTPRRPVLRIDPVEEPLLDDVGDAPERDASHAPPVLLPSRPGALFRSGQPTQPVGARESFLAMHWFTYLSEGTDSSIVFLYLDYYHYVGWIDDASHGWLSRLAEGVARRKEGASWSDYGMDVSRLSRNHLRNLRFLDKMLGTTLQHGEADYLRQTVDMMLTEDG